MSTATASLTLDTNFNVGQIDRRILGGFLEHLGRAVYTGVYDPGNPLSDERGFRKDVLDVLKPLGMPIMRYPGGNYVSACDWKDGIGPKNQRPRRPDYAWRSVETNQFGTDEFMEWCKVVGTEPMMAVNLGTAGSKEAAELLEYCNLKTGTYWADRRAANGHKEPYNVKLWCLGNEMDGPWQAGHVPADVYALRARQASTLMKGMDRSIQTIACGSSARTMKTYLDYDRETLDICWDTVDYISAHRYSENYKNDTPWFLAEGEEISRVIEDYAGLLSYLRGAKRSDKRVYVSFDEWNVWYKAREDKHMNGNWQDAPPLLEEVYNLEDALVCAQYLSAFVRRADVVKVACIAQIVNVIAPVLTRREGLLIQSIYYPFLAYSQNMGPIALTPVVHGAMYKAGERGEVPSLDAAATFDPASGAVSLFLTNRNMNSELTVDVKIGDRTITGAGELSVLGGGDVKAANSWEQPDLVKPKAAKVSTPVGGTVRVTIPAPGFATVKLQTASR